jgi:flagellar assembly protein FliH
MAQTVTISLEQPVGSVQILKDCKAAASAKSPDGEAISAAEMSRKAESFMRAAAALSAAVGKFNEFHEGQFKQHNQQIAKLAVDIARKVLMQEVNDGHYKIEAILQETLKNAPSRENAIVHLNPDDAAFCRRMQQENTSELLAEIKIIADANVKPAECIVETPQGIVESFIETHLQHIAEALANARCENENS